MKCQECHGEGRILLFTSARPCKACEGTGKVAPAAPEASKADPPKLQDAYYPPGSVTITGGTGAQAGGTFTITGGTGTASGLGGDVVLRGGEAGQADPGLWVPNTGADPLLKFDDDSTYGTFTISSSANAGVQLFSMDVAPTKEGIAAPMGSLVVCTEGSLWLKTGDSNQEWCRVSTDSPPTTMSHRQSSPSRPMDPGPETDASGLRDDLIALVVKTIEEYRSDDDRESWKDIGLLQSFPAVAPVSTALVADMMAVIEQEGEEVLAFISSSRDFADVRKFGNDHGVNWEGQHVSFFGIPFWHSNKIEAGYMAAISTGRKLVFCTIMR